MTLSDSSCAETSRFSGIQCRCRVEPVGLHVKKVPAQRDCLQTGNGVKIVLPGWHPGWVARTPPRPGRGATRGDFRPAMQFIGRFWRGQCLQNSPSCSFGTRRQWPPGHPAQHDSLTTINFEAVSREAGTCQCPRSGSGDRTLFPALVIRPHS